MYCFIFSRRRASAKAESKNGFTQESNCTDSKDNPVKELPFARVNESKEEPVAYAVCVLDGKVKKGGKK